MGAISRLVRTSLADRRARKQAIANDLGHANVPAQTYRGLIYYGPGEATTYQVERWMPALEAIAAEYPLVIVTRQPTAALVLQESCPLPVVYIRTNDEVQQFAQRQQPDVAFYVNNAMSNYTLLANSGLTHVTLGHGESDKLASTSNNFKSYDFTFIAGEAGLRRLAIGLLSFDWKKHVRIVGRPQVDEFIAGPPLPNDDRTTVLYAPTWEGDKPNVRYGSVESHGKAITKAITDTGRHRLIYRPHPLIGSVRPQTLQAHEEVVAMIAAANAADPSASHLVDTQTPFGWHQHVLDACICDVSSVAIDWMASGKPLIVTHPAAASTTVDDSGIGRYLDLMDKTEAANAATLIDTFMTDGMPQTYRDLIWYYFGDITADCSTQRFQQAVRSLFNPQPAPDSLDAPTVPSHQSTGVAHRSKQRRIDVSAIATKLRHSVKEKALDTRLSTELPIDQIAGVVYAPSGDSASNALIERLAMIEQISVVSPLMFVSRSARNTARLQQATNLPVAYTRPLSSVIEASLTLQPTFALYFKHVNSNFHLLSIPSLTHAYALGDNPDADLTNQLKGYDVVIAFSPQQRDEAVQRVSGLDPECVIVVGEQGELPIAQIGSYLAEFNAQAKRQQDDLTTQMRKLELTDSALDAIS